jgi:hypothetical protein
MKRLISRSIATFCLAFMSHLANAQMTITEYLPVPTDFYVDLKDAKIIKILYTKGVLDVNWDADNRQLEVAYNPKQTDIEVIINNVNTCAGEVILANKPNVFQRAKGR